MYRYQYDNNNDGVVDHATLADTATTAGTISAQANIRITNGFLQIRNFSDNTWLYVWFTTDGVSGEPIINYDVNPPS